MAIYYLFEWSDDSRFPNAISKASIVGRFDDEKTRPERALELWHIDKSNEIDNDPDTKYIADAETVQWSNDNDMLTLDYSLICVPPQIWHCKVAVSKMASDQPKAAPNNTLENPLTTGLPVFNPVAGAGSTGSSPFMPPVNNNVNMGTPAVTNTNKIKYTASNGVKFEVEDYSNDKTYTAVKTALEINLDKEDARAIVNSIIDDDFCVVQLNSDEAEHLMASFDIDSSMMFGHEDYPDALIENITDAQAKVSKPYEAYSLIADLIMQQYDFKSLEYIADIFNIDDVVMNQVFKWQENQPDYVEKALETYFRHENNNGFNAQLDENAKENSLYEPSKQLTDILGLYEDGCEAWYDIDNPDALLKPDCTKEDCIYAMNELKFPDRIRTAVLNERAKLGYDDTADVNMVGFTDGDTISSDEEADDSQNPVNATTDANKDEDKPRDAYDVIESVYGKELTDADKETIEEQFANFTDDDLNSFIIGLGITDESDKQILRDYRESFFEDNDDDNDNDVSIPDNEANELALQMVAMSLGFNLDDDGINDAHNAIITMSDDEFNALIASLILTDTQEEFITNLHKNGTVSPAPSEHDESVASDTVSPSEANTTASTTTSVDASKYTPITFPMGLVKGRIGITGTAKPMLIRKLARLMTAQDYNKTILIEGRKISIGSYYPTSVGFSNMNASKLSAAIKDLIDNANEVGLEISGELITPVDTHTIRVIAIKHNDYNDGNVNIIDETDITESSDGLFHAADDRIAKYTITENN